MADVLIFDDDPSVGDLLGELLRTRGATVAHFLSGAGVVELTRENKPKLVVLDIMMPGMDGLSALRNLKADPSTKGVKVAILTAKNYVEDEKTALKHGADLFLHKPFDPADFAGTIGKLLGLPAKVDLPPEPARPPVVVSIMPGSVVAQTAGLLLVFDAGQGLRAHLEKREPPKVPAWLMLSRYAPEAVSEASAVSRLLAAGVRVNVAGPDDGESSLQQVAAPMCANAPDGTRATPLLYPQREGEFAPAPGVRVVTRLTQHAGTCLAYRVEIEGRRIVFCPAHEVRPDLKEAARHEYGKFRELFKRADLLVHGASGDWRPVVELAKESGVARLVRFGSASERVIL